MSTGRVKAPTAEVASIPTSTPARTRRAPPRRPDRGTLADPSGARLRTYSHPAAGWTTNSARLHDDGVVATTVYTDGACIGNPGPGGWAWAVPDAAYASGSVDHTTNQRMELTAALEALRAVARPVVVVSDSKYLIDCFEKRWYVGWEKRGWRNASKQPVANQDLWVPLLQEYRRGGQVEFRWVRGHAGDPMNDMVDRLATEAARTQSGRRGSEPPTSLGPADNPGPRATSSTHLPTGWHLVVFGHRPPELGGYEPSNAVATRVRQRVVEVLRGLAVVHPELMVVTGLGLGAEQLGAEAALEAGVPFVAVLAHPDPDSVWPAESRRRYRELVDKAVACITLSATKPTSKQAAGMASGRRNDWLIAHADAAIVVWDRKSSDLRGIATALERQLPDEVWIVEP
jgi:ribonuclease HI/uncharacterized phage-like protein YoqJ